MSIARRVPKFWAWICPKPRSRPQLFSEVNLCIRLLPSNPGKAAVLSHSNLVKVNSLSLQRPNGPCICRWPRSYRGEIQASVSRTSIQNGDSFCNPFPCFTPHTLISPGTSHTVFLFSQLCLTSAVAAKITVPCLWQLERPAMLGVLCRVNPSKVQSGQIDSCYRHFRESFLWIYTSVFPGGYV